ncbi:hypothetical protein KFK09_020910 [Dendrobium nobile]|uniref:Mitochondrial import inner membrane translocase subunit TIM50 n=1 Tax=Dendrobium nobile TaxID=94219 RepID=A0A8T3AN96_DENNO|nr:hypothetical protein KFK09_020910 [Dendrobium nobile]
MAKFLSRIVRNRVVPFIPRMNTRPFSSSTISADPPREHMISSAAILNDPPPVTPTPPPSSPTGTTGSGRTWGLLKFGAIAAITSAVGTAAYVTYAYTVDEVDQKTNTFRALSNYSVGDGASSLEKYKAMLYSTAIKVPAKTIELYIDIRRSIEDHVRGFTEPSSDKLLPDLHPQEQHVFTLVLDLNETLVYSDWKRERGWRTFKRPGVDAFLEHLAKFYEIVVYSDQLNMYVDPVIERLDQKGCIRYRLSRSATRYQDGKHFRDLSKLNRDPARILYVSGHALESSLQPENCVPIKPWTLENDDTALLDLIPFLEYIALHRPADIRPVLASYQGRDIAAEFIERSKEHQRRMQQQKQHGHFWRR